MRWGTSTQKVVIHLYPRGLYRHFIHLKGNLEDALSCYFLFFLFYFFYHWGNQEGTFAVNMGQPPLPWGEVGGQWMYEGGHGPTSHLLTVPLYSMFDFLTMEW